MIRVALGFPQVSFVILAALVASSAACAGPGASSAAYIRGTGRVVREYDAPGAHVIVVQSGPLVRKWRQVNGGAEMQLEVDTTTHICKAGTAVADCELIKRDPDLAPFVTWNAARET